MRTVYFIVIYVFVLFQAGCVAEPIVERSNDGVHEAQTERIHAEMMKYLAHGYWIVTRGYHATDNLVVNATGVPLSHVGVYDQQRGHVIEAEGKGVHTTELLEFINKSHRLLIIKPRWYRPERSDIAVERARDLVGKNYDFLGTIGFNSPSRYYCSELAVEVYSDWRDSSEKIPTVIKPGELYLWGQVLYDSLPRG